MNLKKSINNIPEMLEPYMNKDEIEVGMDEAGRGPLFGRVYVGAAILPPDDSFNHSLMRDSKKLNERKRLIAFDYIKENAIDWVIHYKDEKYIDKHNIFAANYNTMYEAVNKLLVKPDHILVDGNYFKPCMYNDGDYINHTTVVKGDDKYTSIAAASILAKVGRDKYIQELCDKYPLLDEYYGIRSNKGYGAKKHMEGIKTHGISPWHRKTFGLCKISKINKNFK
jgi:ribonuclease HII